ncbi:hypothetical protein IFM89_005002 [Coptis chinensis]|uniref:Uncharacterized protein n=1 Tax=Coptis chinensis TaxID=261450 RepID=A0A835HNL7_9MAGN|nr:hypothetical protein IFM89_005002 [Coptis chinensis]
MDSRMEGNAIPSQIFFFVLIGILEALGLLWDDVSGVDLVDLRDVKIVKKLGGSFDDLELVKGLVLIRSIVVLDYNMKWIGFLKEERNYILGMIKKIKGDGCNVLLIRKSILRDAILDPSLHYLSKAKILVVKDVERDAIEFITKTELLAYR